ncbi:uncharacterized protein VP01_2252g2 [Puccinia sorghi]|uniref:Uncharacterized protein n=1 Tax=Puccinia sorghi TaxID=27349 RepID=A0A0L6VAB3_9BASI|nr:uncharacterized protein VP01_2252g2 [Puccinia sorghi]
MGQCLGSKKARIESNSCKNTSVQESESKVQKKLFIVETIIVMSELYSSSTKLVTTNLDVNNFSTWHWGIITALGYKNLDDYILEEFVMLDFKSNTIPLPINVHSIPVKPDPEVLY